MSPAHDVEEGSQIARRYQLLRRLGTGAFGEVWEADDEVGKRRVALKILRASADRQLARIQLEVTALRLRLPGIVELFDSGLDGNRPYLAMELVEGVPFPGRKAPCSWVELADVAIALLETLARVHAAAVLHRDLKPANVLVTSEGHVRILDFGFAYLTNGAPEDRLTLEEELAGTPAYVAPEQLRGEATEQSDLYAVGVMLYEALSGRLPHEGNTVQQLLFARLQRVPRPLSDLVPDVPPAVARVVDQLLSTELSKRPPSAAAALILLRGEQLQESPFPWLGPQTQLLHLVAAVRASLCMDVLGPRGSGRTRHLQALAQALERQREVIWLPSGDCAFSSLSMFLGALSDHAEATFEQVDRRMTERVREALARGTVIIADDMERVDRWSARTLEELRGQGAVIRSFRTALGSGPDSALRSADRIILQPLAESELQSLFAGPNRLFHLREDAARALHARTGGNPARIVREVSSWLALGFAKWSSGRLAIARETLDQFDSGLWTTEPIETDREAIGEVSPSLVETLVWTALAAPHAEPTRLARASRQPLFRVEADATELRKLGIIERLSDGRLVPRVSLAPSDLWPPSRLRAARRDVASALPAGSPRRLVHLLLAGAESEEERISIGAETATLAARQIDSGRPAQAIAAVEHGLRALRDLESPTAASCRQSLLMLWVEAAIADGTAHALDRVIFALCRTSPRDDTIAHLELLSRAALGLDEFGTRPLALVDSVPPFANWRIERARQTLRIRAARRLRNPTLEETILEEIKASIEGLDSELLANVHNAHGRLQYSQGKFREAADLHAIAAKAAASPLSRIFFTMEAAVALIDAFALKEAETLIGTVWSLLSETRHPHYETLATWTERTIRYRRGETLKPDLELTAAAAQAGNRYFEGLICFNEAAIAWRVGADTTLPLVERAHHALSGIGGGRGALLMRALRATLEDVSADEIAGLLLAAREPLAPGIGVQVFGLLALSLHAKGSRLPVGSIDEEVLSSLLEPVPPSVRHLRMDILSVDEAVEAVRRALGD